MPILPSKQRSYGYLKEKQKQVTEKIKSSRLVKRGGGLKKTLSLAALSLFVFGFLFLTILVAWTSKDLPSGDGLISRNVAESTKIYDRTGTHLLYEVYANQKRTSVELKDIPKNLVNGVIATEDTQFYTHHGVRPLSILRAVFYGVFTSKKISGTSTLTQQLVKNAILTNERSYIRKLKEIVLSIRIEQKFTKDQILQIYFNEIPYGSTNYGVETASQSYFGKHVSDLNLAECATLAGLPQQPSKFLNDLEALKNRRDFVLERMVAEKYISREEADKAQAEPLNLQQQFSNMTAPHFVLYAKEQLVEKYGETMVETGGLKVITSLDWDKQQAAEKAVKEVGDEKLGPAGANNASLVALDPKNGQILAMVGSRDFKNNDIKGQFNVATLGKRQPGSSFKPIIYAAAFEKGYTPDTILFDVVTNFAASGKPYIPKNYDLKEHGPVTMRQALQGSLNIPAVQTLYLVGPKKGVEFAERMGYTTLSDGDFGLTLVLGGGEVNLLEHTSAYSIFANNGNKQTPVSILKVEDKDGKVLEEWQQEKGEEVLDPKIAATVSNVLSDDGARAYVFGAGGVLTLPGRPVAVKTGTTNNYVDAWTVGYTPSLVAGVWVGNTDNTPMKFGADSSKVAAPIWNKFMQEALKGSAVESFPTPPPNDAEKPVLRGSAGGGITLSVDKITGKLASSSTPPEDIEQRTYIQPHSILQYVNKDDPRGDYPTDPGSDPQYSIWESAIQDWISRRQTDDPGWNVSFEDPPTEYDDLHSLELIPTLEVFYPEANSTIRTRDLETNIKVSAPRGVSQVTYKIDGNYLDVVKQNPFNLKYKLDSFENGGHILTIIVEDDIGDRIIKEIPFTLDAPEAKPGVYFEIRNLNIQKKEFPKTILLSNSKLDKIKTVKIFVEDGQNKNLLFTVNDFSSLFDGKILFEWEEAPNPGNYGLISEVELLDGSVYESDRKNITVSE